jgi:hypothetical protein
MAFYFWTRPIGACKKKKKKKHLKKLYKFPCFQTSQKWLFISGPSQLAHAKVIESYSKTFPNMYAKNNSSFLGQSNWQSTENTEKDLKNSLIFEHPKSNPSNSRSPKLGSQKIVENHLVIAISNCLYFLDQCNWRV